MLVILGAQNIGHLVMAHVQGVHGMIIKIVLHGC